MKLAILGLATIVVGLALGQTGLVAIGALWVALGPVMRRYARGLTELKDASGHQAVDSRTFATGTLLWFALGVPSLLVGLLELGIDPEHAGWRWLPLVVGALAVGIGGLGALLFALGSAAARRATASPPPTVPATIRIRSVTETGTFINERPRLELELLVEPAPGSGVTPYEVTKRATVPYTALGSLAVGDGFSALVVGPDDPTRMEIHWDRPLAADGHPADDVSARLAELDRLHRDGQVSDEEHHAQRERILGSL